MSIEEQILKFVKKERAVYISDVAREFKIYPYTASDLIKLLVKDGKLIIKNKGIAKIVLPK